MVGYRKIERLSAVADSFDLFMIDQFGVLHDGVRPYRGAVECLASLKSRGKSVVLLSNSGKRASANITRLAELGFARELFDHVVTSGEVAWQGIVDQSFGMPFLPGKRMFVVGHDDHDYGFERLGVGLVGDAAAADFIMIAASRAPKMSLDQYGEILAGAAASDIPALCCNPDRLMLTATGVQLSAGEIASLYCKLGGSVTYVGKPYPAMYAFARNQCLRGESARTLAIGDSIEHDICGGFNAHLATALVRTGLSHDLSDEELSNRLAAYGAAPDFVLPRLYWE
ncbi:MAG TPA: TIGR01459 family HAD-type hydrolase [Bradyrhizobium sp.]